MELFLTEMRKPVRRILQENYGYLVYDFTKYPNRYRYKVQRFKGEVWAADTTLEEVIGILVVVKVMKLDRITYGMKIYRKENTSKD